MNFGKFTENYYDTLELSKDCTPKDIKTSFIKLSKKYHPDKNNDSPEAHKNFIKINEAYEVLTKDRRRYDEFLRSRDFTPKANYQQRPGSETESVYEQWLKYGAPERQYSEFYNYQNNSGNRSQYQYKAPIKNIDPSMRWKALAGCLLIVSVGLIGHLIAISRISKFRENSARRRNEIYSIMYSHTKNNAKKYGAKTFDKMMSGEIRNLTLAEATAEYERRHSHDRK